MNPGEPKHGAGTKAQALVVGASLLFFIKPPMGGGRRRGLPHLRAVAVPANQPMRCLHRGRVKPSQTENETEEL